MRYSFILGIIFLGYAVTNASAADLCTATSDCSPTAQIGGNSPPLPLAISENLAAFASPTISCTGGSNCGGLVVNLISGSVWDDRDVSLLPPSPGNGYRFGSSVSLSGSALAVGAPGKPAIFVYRRVGPGSWNQELALVAQDGEHRNFGNSISVSGDVLIAGASTADFAPVMQCGAAYVFRFNGTTWVQEAALHSPDPAISDQFGGKVAVNGNVALVSELGLPQPSVHVYRFSGSQWLYEQRLTAGSGIGPAAATDGNTAIVGAASANAGYVFRFSGTSWNLEQTLTASGSPVVSGLGQAAAIDGSTAVLGSNKSPVVFQFNGTSWQEFGRFGAPFVTFDGEVGVSGSLMVAGGHSNQPNTAAARMFDLNALPTLADCNCDGVTDLCEISFGTEADCNGNGLADSCDVSSGTSFDCNENGMPDECEGGSLDCNANGIPDSCDLASGSSSDCNADGIPDECQLSNNDCNANNIPDDCDITSATSLDCNASGVPDECELGSNDCNGNDVPDDCDIADGTSMDVNHDGRPDECPAPIASLSGDPGNIDKNRYISFVASDTDGYRQAIRVTLVSLMHPDPPNLPQYPAPDFSAFEGQIRWVGEPTVRCESVGVPNPNCMVPGDPTYTMAQLQCIPFYADWFAVAGGGPIHVTGAAVVPSSTYTVEALALSCQGNEANCGAVSAPLTIHTTRWGDVGPSFQITGSSLSQPDVSDVAVVVDKFKGLPGAAITARADLVVNQFINAADLSAVVDAFKGRAYVQAPPTNCP